MAAACRPMGRLLCLAFNSYFGGVPHQHPLIHSFISSYRHSHDHVELVSMDDDNNSDDEHGHSHGYDLSMTRYQLLSLCSRMTPSQSLSFHFRINSFLILNVQRDCSVTRILLTATTVIKIVTITAEDAATHTITITVVAAKIMFASTTMIIAHKGSIAH